MTMRVQAILTLIVVLAVLGLAGCDHYVCSSGATFGASTCTPLGSGLGGGGNASGVAFAYLLGQSGTRTSVVADSLDLGTNSFQEDTTFVSPVFNSTLPANGGTVVVSKGSQKYLYIPFSDGTLYGFAIDGATGALTAVSSNPTSASGGNSIASDPAGNFLFVGDSAANVISAFTIAADGSLASVGSPFPSPISAAQMTTDGKGQFLYATVGPPLGGNQIAAFTITPGIGTLTPLPISPFNFPVTKLLGESTGTYLFGVNGQDANLYVFTINSGVPTPPASPFVTGAVPTDLVVHPTGKFVYTFDGSLSPMEGYQIQSGGSLTAVPNSPFTGIDLDKGQFEQTGLFLFGVGSGAGATFGPYDVSSTGTISVSTFPLLGFLGGDFAVTDLSNAP